jgi:hypothetical protein
MDEYGNSEIRALIDEHIHNERDRALMKRRLCDGVLFEPLAEEFDLSVQRTKAIFYKNMDKLAKYIR